jgi:hypothetical protein
MNICTDVQALGDLHNRFKTPAPWANHDHLVRQEVVVL